jgi:hypothetical protein
MRINRHVLRTDKDYVKVDLVNVAEGMGLIVAVILVAAWSISLSVPAFRHLWRRPGPPPKVITKIVKQSALSEAQQEYIKSCRQSGSGEPNVPDVHADKWTCVNP